MRIVAGILLLMAGFCWPKSGSGTESATPTTPPTPELSATQSATRTLTPSATFSRTYTPSPAVTPTATLNETGTPFPTDTPTRTPSVLTTPSATPPPGSPTADAYEPDDSFLLAKDLAVGQTQPQHNLYPVTDVDWFKIQVDTPQVLQIQTRSSDWNANFIGAVLFDGSGTQPVPDPPPVIYSYGLGEYRATLTYHFQLPGTYYVEVFPGRDPFSFPISDYTISLMEVPFTATPTVTPVGTPTDPYEPDNTGVQAGTFVLGGVQEHHRLNPPGDQDWVKFYVADVPGIVEFSVEAPVDYSYLVLELYDAAASGQLFYAVTSGWRYSPVNDRYRFSQQFHIDLAGWYYLRISSYYADSVVPDYSLSLQMVMPTPTATVPSALLPAPGTMKIFNNWIRLGYAGYERSGAYGYPGTSAKDHCLIRWSQTEDGPTTLTIYDLNGRRVRTLLDRQWQAAGANHELIWDGCDSLGRKVGTGFYLAHVQCGRFTAHGKIAVTHD